MKRGIARRTLFDHSEDMWIFSEQLEEATAQGTLEVHSFCLTTNHYHQLVRSPMGELGAAMQRVQTEYSRWFSRSRRCESALVRGRHRAKRVDSRTYWRAVVSYIDRNPVSANRMDLGYFTASRLARLHRVLVLEDEGYRERAGRVASRGLRVGEVGE